MSVRPSGMPWLWIDGVGAELAVVLQAVNTAYDRNNRVATLERIANALLMKGEAQLRPRLPEYLALLEAREKVEQLDAEGQRWRLVTG